MLDFPPVVMKLSEISGELPVDILNRQIDASGNDQFEQIQPPEYYYKLKGQNPAVGPYSIMHRLSVNVPEPWLNCLTNLRSVWKQLILISD